MGGRPARQRSGFSFWSAANTASAGPIQSPPASDFDRCASAVCQRQATANRAKLVASMRSSGE